MKKTLSYVFWRWGGTPYRSGDCLFLRGERIYRTVYVRMLSRIIVCDLRPNRTKYPTPFGEADEEKEKII